MHMLCRCACCGDALDFLPYPATAPLSGMCLQVRVWTANLRNQVASSLPQVKRSIEDLKEAGAWLDARQVCEFIQNLKDRALETVTSTPWTEVSLLTC